jgi:glycosyltransferase involved in cell wall biosynthesis
VVRRLKVLHLITGSGPYDSLYQIADYTDRSRFDVAVASLEPAGILQKELGARGIPSRAFGCTSRLHYPGTLIQLTRWLRREGVDVLHAHLYDACLVGLTAARLAGTPLAVTTCHHSHEFALLRKRLPLWADCLSSRWLAHSIIAPSPHMKELLVRHENVPGSKVAVIPHGFDLPYWDPRAANPSRVRDEFGLQGKTVFGAVGRMFWIKNYPALVRGFAAVARKDPDAVLLIVGAGDRGPLVQLVRQLGLEKRVIFTGVRLDRLDVYAAMDVLVHAALAESFGMVLVEALAMGKPVVSTPVGIAPEVISDGVTGFLAPSPDPAALQAALERLLESRPRWGVMGEAGRKRAQDFSAPAMVAAYEAHYTTVLRRRGVRVAG